MRIAVGGIHSECNTYSPTQPVILADSGDNPTAGGVGDRSDVLRRLLAHDVGAVLIAGIADQPTTEVCYQHGVGRTVELQVGGPLGGTPSVAVTGEVVFLSATPTARDRQAVVRSGAGPLTLVLTARRRPFHHVADVTALGLDLGAFHLDVVKSGYLAPEVAALANPALMALSPRAVDQDIARLPRQHVRRPTYPFERDFTWAPTRWSRPAALVTAGRANAAGRSCVAEHRHTAHPQNRRGSPDQPACEGTRACSTTTGMAGHVPQDKDEQRRQGGPPAWQSW